MCKSERKPYKIRVYKGSEFYNISMKLCLRDNNTEMYSIHSRGESVATERLIITLKNQIYKYTTSISENVYIDKLEAY